jgi:hypothetical protein
VPLRSTAIEFGFAPFALQLSVPILEKASEPGSKR